MSSIITNPLATPPAIGAAIDSAAASAAASAASNASSSSSSPTSADSLSTEFLQLLMAQLQNQDPEDPVDGTTFVTQLAQFTSVQQETQSATDLGSILSLMQQGASPSASGSAANPAVPSTGGTTPTGSSPAGTS